MYPWSWDRHSDRTTWSPGVATLFGVSLEEFDGRLESFLALLHPEDRDAVASTIERAIADGSVEFEIEHRVLWRSGEVRWLHGRGEVVRDESGPSGIRGVVWDITARKQTELRGARMGRLLAVVAAINRESARGDSAAFLSAACRIAVEEGGFRYAWIGQRESSGRVVPVASAGRDDAYLRVDPVRSIGTAPVEGPTMRAIRERKPVTCMDIANDPEYAPFRDAALAHGFRASAAFPFEHDGVAVGALNVYADQPNVFEEEEVQLLWRLAGDIGHALERIEREERYRALFEQAADGILLFDQSRLVLDANPAFCAMHGYTREELLGMDVVELMGESDYIVKMQVKAALDRGDVFRGERTAKRRDGTTFEVETSVKALRSGARLALVRDVSERNRMRASMEQNERVLALGRLARGVAHEINNPLSYAVLSLDEIERAIGREDARERQTAAIARARDGAERIRRIVRDLSAFGRGDEEAIGPVDLGAMLASAINLTESIVKTRARLVTDFRAERAATGNAHRLGQVAVNLLVNAADAIAEAEPDRNEIRVATFDDDADVVFSVADTGVGMDRETLARAFDPFFTTKPVGVGSGLGLAIAHGIVSRLGGSIAVTSEPGRGTTFTVRLPAWRASGPAASAEAPAASGERRRRRILVVDDEKHIRETLALALDGDDVTTASGAFQAAELCREKDFDCILCDMTMPAGDGIDLLEALRAQGRGAERRLVFMTGGAYTARAESLLARADTPHLDKPFAISAMNALIDRVAAR